MRNVIKNIGLFILLLNTTQAPVEASVRVGFSGEKLVPVVVNDEELGHIGFGVDYDKNLLADTVKRHLNAEHPEYDYRLSKIVGLPEELLDNTEIEINCVKEQLYCMVSGTPHHTRKFKTLFFPQLGLRLIVEDDQYSLERGRCDDLAELNGVRIMSFDCAHVPSVEEPQTSIPLNSLVVRFNERTMDFFDKIRKVFMDNRGMRGFYPLFEAIKLAGIPYYDENNPNAEIDKEIIRDYLASVGLLATDR